MKNKTVKIGLGLGAVGLILAGIVVSNAREPSHKVVKKEPEKVVAPAPGTTKYFGSWGISCTDSQGQKLCTLGQEVRRKEDNARLLLLEVKPNSTSQASAGLTLPLGLDLAKGLSMQIDNGPVVNHIAFSACYQQGCIVPMSFDAATLDALRTGKELKISAPIANNNNSINFQLSLAGFKEAYSMMNGLVAQAQRNQVKK